MPLGQHFIALMAKPETEKYLKVERGEILANSQAFCLRATAVP